MSDTWSTTAVAEGGVVPEGPGAAAVTLRANILDMTQTAEEAVLAPEDCGAWPADLRAALASRIARLNRLDAVADRYAGRMSGTAYAGLTDPGQDGAAEGVAEVVAFMDKVAMQTRDIAAADIATLQAAGIHDADIVRLCELNAFLAYQLRLIAGLRLMTEVRT
ncbi:MULTISPECIES: hypothetical protein [unclassified Meridianimarinicoccus]|uniref:hypothetical protein n=1 Tax=unclassified Meridianimarinicoccus TaxID=2923344 RepID=UPI001D0222BA|nr:hypothetical protein [Fluviibacterium sp. MJW13]